MAEPVLEVRHVVREFGEGDARTRVLHGISLTVRSGELSALVGPSGSGKSTLLNIMGLLDRPSSGAVLIGGRDTTQLDDRALTELRGRTLGFVFQFHHLMPAFSALENVLMPAYADRGRVDSKLDARGLQLLASVGLTERAHHSARDLSGGEAQRVALARALANEPALVLADEPTGNLDTHSAEAVFGLLRRFCKERGTTFLLVTHDSRLAARCDRIVTLVDGRVVSDARRGAADTAPGTFSET